MTFRGPTDRFVESKYARLDGPSGDVDLVGVIIPNHNCVDQLRAEIERMRPVVGAAIRWSVSSKEGYPNVFLLEAVRRYREGGGK